MCWDVGYMARELDRLLGRLWGFWLGPSQQVDRGLSLRLHGGMHGRVLQPIIQSDHMDPRLGTGKYRKIKRRRKRLRNILDKIKRVHCICGGPRGEDGMHS